MDKGHYCSKIILPIFMLLSWSAYGMYKIPNSGAFVPRRLGNLELVHDSDGFQVRSDRQIVAVKKHLLDKALRSMNPEQLKSFLENNGYIAVNESDGEYSLTGRVRGLGGGPISGFVAYAITKTFGYTGTAVACIPTLVAIPSPLGPVAAVAAPAAITATVATGTVMTEAAALGVGVFFTAIPFLP